MTATPTTKQLTALEELELEIDNDPTVTDEFRAIVQDIRKTETVNNELNRLLKLCKNNEEHNILRQLEQ